MVLTPVTNNQRTDSQQPHPSCVQRGIALLQNKICEAAPRGRAES